jgi:Ca2+-binding EF-hand superfamily protein
LDFDEFVEFAIYQKLSETQPRVYFQRAFEAFDTNKTGTLDPSELGKFFTLVGVDGVDEVTKALEAASAGKGLTFDEFARLADLPPAA